MHRYYSFLLCLVIGLITITSKAQSKIKVACVGNSITYGSGIEDRDTYSYPAQLQKLLGESYEVGNFGKPGATLLQKGHRPYQSQEEFKQAKEFKADIVVIHLGINDTDPRNWPLYSDEFVGDYLGLIDAFKKVNPKTRFLLAEMTPISHRHPRFESGTRDWHIQIQKAIRTVAQVANCELIDFFTPLYPYPHCLPDGLHPNEEGALKLAKVVYGGISGDYGGLSLPDIFGDGMVLPHGKPFSIKGKANGGEKVQLKLNNKKYNVLANNRGDWEIQIDPIKAGGPYELIINSDTKELKFNNIVAGEIWLCSGQSNMEFKLQQSSTGQDEITQADNKNIRLYNMDTEWRTNAVEWPVEALEQINDLAYFKPTQWSESTPETAASFSAIGYHFGKTLQDSLQVPIGLICNAVGGATQESWISRYDLELEFPRILYSWTGNDFIQAWVRGRGKQNIAQSANPLQRHPYEPAYLYEAGIAPISDFPINGVIWYQGESNAHNLEAYARLFKIFVSSWRKAWNNPDLPVLYVQLSSMNRPSWPKFRDLQRVLSDEIENVGMVVSSDYGDANDVHPIVKKPIGERLARLALQSVYDYPIIGEGPKVISAELVKGEVLLTFENGIGLSSSDNDDIRSFEVAEFDGVYFPVTNVEIKGNQIRLKANEVKNPCFIRYGWQPYTDANLINEAGLPASTFKLSLPYKK